MDQYQLVERFNDGTELVRHTGSAEVCHTMAIDFIRAGFQVKVRPVRENPTDEEIALAPVSFERDRRGRFVLSLSDGRALQTDRWWGVRVKRSYKDSTKAATHARIINDFLYALKESRNG